MFGLVHDVLDAVAEERRALEVTRGLLPARPTTAPATPVRCVMATQTSPAPSRSTPVGTPTSAARSSSRLAALSPAARRELAGHGSRMVDLDARLEKMEGALRAEKERASQMEGALRAEKERASKYKKHLRTTLKSFTAVKRHRDTLLTQWRRAQGASPNPNASPSAAAAADGGGGDRAMLSPDRAQAGSSFASPAYSAISHASSQNSGSAPDSADGQDRVEATPVPRRRTNRATASRRVRSRAVRNLQPVTGPATAPNSDVSPGMARDGESDRDASPGDDGSSYSGRSVQSGNTVSPAARKHGRGTQFAVRPTKPHSKMPLWATDKQFKKCLDCAREFTFLTRRHVSWRARVGVGVGLATVARHRSGLTCVLVCVLGVCVLGVCVSAAALPPLCAGVLCLVLPGNPRHAMAPGAGRHRALLQALRRRAGRQCAKPARPER